MDDPLRLAAQSELCFRLREENSVLLWYTRSQLLWSIYSPGFGDLIPLNAKHYVFPTVIFPVLKADRPEAAYSYAPS